jgi:peptide deformylase
VEEETGQVRNEELDPQREARRRLALAQIRQYPDPVLRMKAREIEAPDDDVRRLVERMFALMSDANGVGLAATQVGILRRLFVFHPAEGETASILNPQVVKRSDETEVDDEGCLSLQGVHVPVERSLEVTLEGIDETGAPVSYALAELAARVVQHELDHLDGVLILDRTSRDQRKAAMRILREAADQAA